MNIISRLTVYAILITIITTFAAAIFCLGYLIVKLFTGI